MKKFIVTENQKLKTFTDNFYPQGSFAFSRLLKDKDIRINGKKTGENVMLFEGDEITYFTSQREENIPFYECVYEDENVLVVDKYAGVNSEALFFSLSEIGECYFIHRLDRNTAGLMIFAKTKDAEKSLLKAFKQKTIKKIYHAVCFYKFKKESATLCDYLVKDNKAARVKVYSAPKPNSEKIITEYKVVKNIGEYSLVEITLHSGKTHQIRAHMAFSGNPVAGDEKYGDEKLNKKYKLKRQVLVAKYLQVIKADGLEYLSKMRFVSKFDAEIEPNK